MTTKAEWFRYEAERAGPKQARASIPTVTAALAAKGMNEPHNLATRSGNRQKTDAQFRMKREASEVRTSTKTGVGRKR